MSEIETTDKNIDQIKLPLILIETFIFFPHMITPIFILNRRQQELIQRVNSTHGKIFVTTYHNESISQKKHYYKTGTVCSILKTREMSNNKLKILLQGLYKASIVEEDFNTGEKLVLIKRIQEIYCKRTETEASTILASIKVGLEKLSALGKVLSPEIVIMNHELELPGKIENLITNNLNLHIKEQQKLLETKDPVTRLKKIYRRLCSEISFLQEQNRLRDQTKQVQQIFQNQIDLKEQLKFITNNIKPAQSKYSEYDHIRKKIDKLCLPANTTHELLTQLKRLEKLPPESGESSILQTYLDVALSLPWCFSSKDNLSIARVENILNKEHYGLNKVKERIIEYLCVKKLNPKGKSPILCLVGPPGVGKTSLGQSIATALNRNFVRISLGGIKDESDIRGHRRTYIGAYPGKIIQSIRSAGCNNPIIMLDEIDKLSRDRGDPSAALLEILDPEQNNQFIDHYLNIPYDLSNVLFITNANSLTNIILPLKDRLEILELGGYSEEEKVKISKKYLWPKILKETGIDFYKISFAKGVMNQLIRSYTKESGLRSLEKEIANICRKLARKAVKKNTTTPQQLHLTHKKLRRFLGEPLFRDKSLQIEREPGLALALAYTNFGGEILTIETKLIKGASKLVLTGRLGDVMKESAKTALNYIKAHASQFNLSPNFFDHKEIHIHIPEGALPKEGPSAGIAITSSILSALTKKASCKTICMTGEITLRGKILPVGGLKEKILAARQKGVNHIIIPKDNYSQLRSLSSCLTKEMIIYPAEEYNDVFKILYPDKRE